MPKTTTPGFVDTFPSTRFVAPGLAALALFASGCSGDHANPAPVSSTVESRAPQPTTEQPGPSGTTGSGLAASIARLSQEVRGQTTVPSAFCENTNANPQRLYSKTPLRLIVNTLCQPPLGEPASLYAAANASSEKVGIVHDGDVIDGLCIEPHGQETTNVTGKDSASETWVRVKHGSETGFISEVNLAYVDDQLFKSC